jgi:hypothetical protein
MNIFTLYNHGTGSHREKIDGGELVTIFGSRATGVEYQDYLITDGVGYAPKKDKANPMPGTFDPDSPNKAPVDRKAAVLRGNVFGTGAGDNVRRAIDVIPCANYGVSRFRALAAAKPIDRINMVGWSRGAVTCLRIARPRPLPRLFPGRVRLAPPRQIPLLPNPLRSVSGRGGGGDGGAAVGGRAVAQPEESVSGALICSNKKAENYFAMLHLALALISLPRLRVIKRG